MNDAVEKAKKAYYDAKAAYESTAFGTHEDQWAARQQVSQFLAEWLKAAKTAWGTHKA